MRTFCGWAILLLLKNQKLWMHPGSSAKFGPLCIASNNPQIDPTKARYVSIEGNALRRVN